MGGDASRVRVRMSRQEAAAELGAIKEAITTSDWPALEVYGSLNLAIQRAFVRYTCRAGSLPSKLSILEGCNGRIPDFPVTRSHPPASWPSAANSSICRTYRKTAGEESRRRSPVANRWMRP